MPEVSAERFPKCIKVSARAEGLLVGQVTMRPGGPRFLNLMNLWVDPRQRGRGVGGRMVKLCQEEARAAGYRAIVLIADAEPGRTRALRGFYRRLGFRQMFVGDLDSLRWSW